MARKPIIFGNWKMNKTPAEAQAFFAAMKGYLTGNEKAEYGVAVPYVDLDVAVKEAGALKIAAENCNEADAGAFTGEISVPMLKEIGITYCVIGHSERRMYYAETSAHCAAKAKRLFAMGITPILCVGETEAEYDAGKTEAVVKTELKESLADLSAAEVGRMVIAYEPIWAIGTGKSADVDTAEKCCRLVRDTVRELYGDDAAETVRIQYGGSVKPANIKEYMACADIDGALIGGASLKVDSFKALIDETK